MSSTYEHETIELLNDTLSKLDNLSRACIENAVNPTVPYSVMADRIVAKIELLADIIIDVARASSPESVELSNHQS